MANEYHTIVNGFYRSPSRSFPSSLSHSTAQQSRRILWVFNESTAIRYAITHLFHLKLIIKTFHLFHAHFNMIFFSCCFTDILWSTHMLYVISRCFSIIHPWHHHYSGSGTTRSHHFEYMATAAWVSLRISSSYAWMRWEIFEAWAITMWCEGKCGMCGRGKGHKNNLLIDKRSQNAKPLVKRSFAFREN